MVMVTALALNIKQAARDFTSLLRNSDETINRGLFWPHMHSIWHEIKRSWHSTEGGSVMVGVERVGRLRVFRSGIYSHSDP